MKPILKLNILSHVTWRLIHIISNLSYTPYFCVYHIQQSQAPKELHEWTSQQAILVLCVSQS